MSDTDDDKKSVPSSEMVTTGARLSPYEDFKLRTLSALEGLWAKLFYMAQLRSAEGRYEHWGHRRAHGEQCSQEALAQIHSELYFGVLRTPLRELIPDGVAALERITNEIFLAGDALIPSDTEAHYVRHFNSIVLAVRLVHAARRASSRSAA